MDNNSFFTMPHLNTAHMTELGYQLPHPVSHPLSGPVELVNPEVEAAACTSGEVLSSIIQLLERQDVSNIIPIREQQHVAPALGPLAGLIIQRSSTALLVDTNDGAAAAHSAPAVRASDHHTQNGHQSNVAQVPDQQPGSSRKLQQPHAHKAQQSADQRQAVYEGDVPTSAAPAPKRRRISPSEQEDLPVPFSAQNVAGTLRSKVASFLSKAQPEEQADDAAEEDQASGSPFITAAMLRQLSEDIQHAKHHRALALLDQDALLQVLTVLHHHITLGLTPLIQRDDGDASDSFRHSLLAVDAANVALHILTAADMPKALYLEELVTSIISLLKYQLQYNGLVFWDEKLWRTWRGSSEDVEMSPASKKGSAKKEKVPKTVSILLGRLQLTAQLAADLMPLLRVDPNTMSPLVRLLLTALTVEGVQELQAKAIVLLVSIFQHDDSQQQGLLDELLNSTLTNLSSSKNPPRQMQLDGDVRIQMCSALIIQLVQVSCSLPQPGTAAQQVMNSFGWAHSWADKIMGTLLDKMPHAKAQKSDTATDFKQFMENFITDLCQVQHLPDWPAANTLLKRLASMLDTKRGLKSSDANVRLMCVDFLGQLVQRLCSDSKAVASEQWVHEYLTVLDVELQGQEWDKQQELTRAVALHLASSNRPLAASARDFMCTRYLAEQLLAHKAEFNRDATEEEVAQYLKQARQLTDRRSSPVHATSSAASLDRGQAAKVVRRLNMQGKLGQGKMALIKWLVDAGSRASQDSAQARAKAVKWLGQVIEVDQTVLQLDAVQHGVRSALMDDAVSAREAALELLGRHISNNQELALAYFETICKASQGEGITVKKRAVKILHECCVQCPNFPLAAEAMMHIVSRVGDHEESMRSLVTKICSELWFAPTDGSSQNSSAVRAQQLAQVAMQCYTAGGQAIHVPLASDHGLVMIMNEVLTQESRPNYEACRKGARQVCESLLSLILQQQDAAGGNSDSSMLPYLLALHAISAADVELCMPKADPAKFVRSLQPLLGLLPSSKDDALDRRAAERIICILSIVDAFCKRASGLEQALVLELSVDFNNIIMKQVYVSAMAAACKCWCSLSKLQPGISGQVADQTRKLFEYAQKCLQAPTVNSLKLLSRFCQILGHICRYGADILDEAAGEHGNPTPQQLLDFLVGAFNSSSLQPRTKDAMLQAIGMVCIPRPALLVGKNSVNEIYSSMLQPDAEVLLKLRALNNLCDLLKAEEDGLVAAQRQAGEDNKLAQLASTKQGKESRALAKQNGQGDGTSLSSGMLHQLWSQIRDCAKDVRFAGEPQQSNGNGSPPGSPRGGVNSAVVRGRALDLIEITLRGGLVAPWDPIPTLVALATDAGNIQSQAIRILKTTNTEKYSDFLSNQLVPGFKEAYKFQLCLWQSSHPGTPLPKAPSSNAIKGLSDLYISVVWENRQVKTKLLQLLLKPFDAASNMFTRADVVEADLGQLSFLAHVAADLAYRRADEPLMVIQSLDDIIKRRSDAVMNAFHAALKAAHAAAGYAGDNDDEVLHSLPQQGLPQQQLQALQVAVKAAQALCMLLILKQFLQAAYSLTADRVAGFTATGERRKQEEKAQASRSSRLTFKLDLLNFLACEDPSGQLLMEQYNLFRQLLDTDAADHKDQLDAALAGDDDVLGEVANRSHLPVNTPAGAALHVFKQQDSCKTTRGRGGKTTRGRGGGKRGGGVGITAKKTTGKKRRGSKDSDDDSDEDYDGTPQPRTVARRRLERVLH